MLEEITVPCELCGDVYGDLGTCDPPTSPWPVEWDYPLDEVPICPPSDGDPELSPEL